MTAPFKLSKPKPAPAEAPEQKKGDEVTSTSEGDGKVVEDKHEEEGEDRLPIRFTVPLTKDMMKVGWIFIISMFFVYITP